MSKQLEKLRHEVGTLQREARERGEWIEMMSMATQGLLNAVAEMDGLNAFSKELALAVARLGDRTPPGVLEVAEFMPRVRYALGVMEKALEEALEGFEATSDGMTEADVDLGDRAEQLAKVDEGGASDGTVTKRAKP